MPVVPHPRSPPGSRSGSPTTSTPPGPTPPQTFLIYGQLPSYRAMLDHEGLGGPEDLAIIGDEATCAGRIDELVAAGVTQFAASEFADNPEDRARTRAFLATRI